MTEIAVIVSKGVPDKGMPPWGPLLSENEIHSVVSFIKSLRGSRPAGAKTSQGVLVRE